MIRKVVAGSGLLALIPTVSAATPVQSPKKTPAKPPPMTPAELPIYEAPHAEYLEYLEAKENESQVSYLKSALMEPVRAVREIVQTGLEHTDMTLNIIQDQFHEIRDHTDWIVQYLREEENKEMRYGAVAMGGLTGFILGLRGGIIRRLVYLGAGTTAMGAVCFPEDTAELISTNASLMKQYVNIAYNFLYGVKPGDPQLEFQLPELSFPKNLSEVVDLSASVASTVKQAIMPPPTKEEISKDAKPADEKKDKKS